MIYIFDKTQSIIKVLTNDDFTAAHLNFKINTATTFEFSLPASKALPSDSKYVATPHPLDDSKFIMLRLTERVDNTETIDYSAYELAYQELATDGYIEDKRPQNQSALNLMKIALDGSNWELNNVNVSGTATTNFYYVDRLSAISKVVDLLGGEIVFYIEIQGNAISGRYMDYLARQGSDTSKVFASGSNLLTVERQSDTSNIYTAILPRGKGEEIDNGDADTPDGYGRRINIADVEWKKSSGKPLDKPKGSIVLSDPDATTEWGQINGNARLLLQTYDDIDDVNVLINSAYKTLQSVNHPQIQYSATVADVGGLSLGDTVLIMHGDRDLSYKTRVFEVKYDLLAPDQTELSLGDDLSSNSITSQLNSLNAVADTTSSQTQWTINQIGRPSTTFGNTEPANPKVGDVFFKELPDGGTEIYRWNGDIWELLASPTTADDIATAVTDAVSQAKAHTDEVKQVLSSDIATAKSQAASQASTAEANAKSAATSQFNQAQSALSAAKSDLTNSIASEASARNAAVAAANSQAQTYANQAKADAMSAASSADGVIRTAISSSANSLSSTITQNKSSADSGISTAQTTAQAAVDGLKFKVSQTDYNTKTGQLQTDLTATTQTANQAKTDIVSIKQTDTSQDARMTQIESDASGVKTTVSNLQTAQGKQSGDISTLQQRADGFDATVTKVNNLSVGGRNYLLNSDISINKVSSSDTSIQVSSNYINQSVTPDFYSNKKITASVYIKYNNIKTIATTAWKRIVFAVAFKDSSGNSRYMDAQRTITTIGDSFEGRVSTTIDLSGFSVSSVPTCNLYIQGITADYMEASNPKLEVGTISTDWTPAPEDTATALAQVKITADSISNFVRDSSGNISSDFQTALSKTSIITGSTLATSIQTQTSSQITSALTDNNGKIISLINQDSSGVQIAGKNIVLDGNTTVTGAFKVSQANIANGAIGTAQIGDAAITDAKIANLDVSKITGNVTNFIQSYWNGVYGSTTMNANGLSVQSGSMTTLFDSSGAHFAQGTRTAQYSFGNWIDNTGAATSAVGLYMGLRGDNNSFLDIVGPSGAAVAVIAGSDMADGANTNNVRGAINLFADTNIRSKLLFKGNDTVKSTYIEANEIARTMNFYTDNAKDGNGNWFWFNHKVLSEGTFSSTSLLSKKNVIANYEEDALSEISKTDIVEFEYKNNVGEKHISPIIDDVNDEKDYYIPETILGENNQYVDMYSMISMAWKAIQQLNEKMGEK